MRESQFEVPAIEMLSGRFFRFSFRSAAVPVRSSSIRWLLVPFFEVRLFPATKQLPAPQSHVLPGIPEQAQPPAVQGFPPSEHPSGVP